MRQLKTDERAENPIEVGFYVFVVVLVMAFLMLVVGAFLDQFNTIMSGMGTSLSLSAWGTGELAVYLYYISWAYRIPIIFIIIVLIWGVRAVIRKHTYTTAQNGQQYMNTEEEF